MIIDDLNSIYSKLKQDSFCSTQFNIVGNTIENPEKFDIDINELVREVLWYLRGDNKITDLSNKYLLTLSYNYYKQHVPQVTDVKPVEKENYRSLIESGFKVIGGFEPGSLKDNVPGIFRRVDKKDQDSLIHLINKISEEKHAVFTIKPQDTVEVFKETETLSYPYITCYFRMGDGYLDCFVYTKVIPEKILLRFIYLYYLVFIFVSALLNCKPNNYDFKTVIVKSNDYDLSKYLDKELTKDVRIEVDNIQVKVEGVYVVIPRTFMLNGTPYVFEPDTLDLVFSFLNESNFIITKNV